MFAATVAAFLLRITMAHAGCPDAMACTTVVPSGVGEFAVEEVQGELDGIPLARPLRRRIVGADGRVIGPELELPAPTGAMLPPVFDAPQARMRVLEETAFAIESLALVVIERGGTPHPAWRVDPYPDPHTLAHPIVWVDAVTGDVWLGPDRTVHALGRAFPRNPILDAKPVDYELEFLDDGADVLVGPRFRGMSCEAPATGATCVYADVPADPDGNWRPTAPDVDSEADNTDPDDRFAAVSVFTHADRFARFALDHGLGGLPCQPSVLVANYRGFTAKGYLPVANAAYTGDCSLTAVFGQGRDADWGYDGDVIYHELTHGLIDRLMGEDRFLGLTRHREEAVVTDAGAIGEAIADFAAAVITGNPAHAEYVTQVGGATGRDATNDLRCPDGILGEIHYDSEILSGALWDAHEDLGDELLTAIMLSVAVLPEDATFEEASAAFVEVTGGVMGREAARILADHLADRGLDDCPRVVPWNRISRELWVLGSFTGPAFDPVRPPAVQLAFTMPPDRSRLVVRFDMEIVPPAGWSPEAELDALVKFDAPIRYEYSEFDAMLVNADPDVHLPDVGEGKFEVEAPPSATVYVSFVNRHVTRVVLTSIRASFRGPVEPDAGDAPEPEPPDDDQGDPGAAQDELSTTVSEAGCGCRRGRPARAAGWLSLLMLLLIPRGGSAAARTRSRSGCCPRTRSCRAVSR